MSNFKMGLILSAVLSGVTPLCSFGAGGDEGRASVSSSARLIEFQDRVQNREATILSAISATTQALPSDSRLEPRSIAVDPQGTTHSRLRLIYKGLPVIGADITMHVDRDDIARTIGVLPRIPPIETRPGLTETEIRTLIAAELDDYAIDDERTSIELRIRLLRQTHPKRELQPGYEPTATDFHRVVTGARLVYVARVIASRGEQRESLALEFDAHSGELLARNDMRWHQEPPTGPTLPNGPLDPDPPGSASTDLVTGLSQYSGTVQVPTREYDRLFPVLGRGIPVQGPLLRPAARVAIDVRSLDGDSPVAFPVWDDLNPFIQAPPFLEPWGNGQNYTTDDLATSDPAFSKHGQTAAIDVLHGAQVTWDLWQNVFGHAGLDGHSQKPFKLVVHAAQWLGGTSASPYFHLSLYETGAAVFPDPHSGSKQQTAPETVGHELGHGMFAAAMNFEGTEYLSEYGGINEANSDILGTLTEFYASAYSNGGAANIPTTGGNWTIGEKESANGRPIRYMYKPSLDGVSYDAWFEEMDDWGCLVPHWCAGVMNRMFYFLSQGTEPIEDANPITPLEHFNSEYLPDGMTGIGIDKAGRIWFDAVKHYLIADATFEQMRYAAELASSDLYGAFSTEYQAVQDAFAAVNVGPPADRTPPLITISVDGDKTNHSVHVSLDDPEAVGGTILVEARKLRIDDPLTFNSTFDGSTGTLNIGDVSHRTLRVYVTASDMAGNAKDKEAWFDYEAPLIVDADDENTGGNDGVVCKPVDDHHINTRTCTVEVIDTLSLRHIEVYRNGTSTDPVTTVYPNNSPGPSGGQVWLPFVDDLCIPPFCSTGGWPTVERETFEFEIDLEEFVEMPGRSVRFYVLAHDASGNRSNGNGWFTLHGDEWGPDISNIQISGNNNTREFRASIIDAFDSTSPFSEAITANFRVDGDLLCLESGFDTSEFQNGQPFQPMCHSPALPNGTHTLQIEAYDQWDNLTVRESNFTVDYEPPEPPEPPECSSNVLYETEPNQAFSENEFKPCHSTIRGNYDATGNGTLETDWFKVLLEPGQRLHVTSAAYCGDAYFQICISSGNCSIPFLFGTSMAWPLNYSIENTWNLFSRYAYVGVIYLDGICGYDNYNLGVSVVTP